MQMEMILIHEPNNPWNNTRCSKWLWNYHIFVRLETSSVTFFFLMQKKLTWRRQTNHAVTQCTVIVVLLVWFQYFFDFVCYFFDDCVPRNNKTLVQNLIRKIFIQISLISLWIIDTTPDRILNIFSFKLLNCTTVNI